MRKQTSKNTPHHARLRYGLVSTLLLLAILAVLTGANVLVTGLEKKNAWRTDLSFNRQTSYGEITAAVLQNLDRDVHAYMFIDDEPLCELLDRYAAATPRFTWERADLAVSPGLIAKFTSTLTEESVTSDSIVFYCKETDRWRTVTAGQLLAASFDAEGNLQITGLRYENAITNAIRYVTAEKTCGATRSTPWRRNRSLRTCLSSSPPRGTSAAPSTPSSSTSPSRAAAC